ncbi:MAG: FAD-dependent oxidoreductase [Anaerolineales bacterium]
MSARAELVVVGAGPAGMEAALAAAEAGVDVVLVDAAPAPGGQYYQALPAPFTAADRAEHDREGDALRGRLASSSARLLAGTTVWGAFPTPGGYLLTLEGPEGVSAIEAPALVLATGAYDRPVAFPGWTLPGVLTAGAAQLLVKHQRVLPGRRCLLSGSGPLQLALADHLVRAGAEVAAVLEARSFGPRTLAHAPALWSQWRRLREGLIYAGGLLRAHIPYRTGRSVVEARGQGQVEEAVIARVDARGFPVPGTEQRLEIDTLLVGYGLLPNTMLSRLLGCAHERSAGGDLVPRRSATLESSLPGVYVAGDAAGIGGAELARLEGRLAGLAASHRLWRLDDEAFESALARLERPLARQRRFAEMLEALFTPGPGLYSLAQEETVICRCEGVTLGELRRATAEGVRTVNGLKRVTRAGMGNCQGRTCGALVARALVDGAAESGLNLDSVGAFRVRPPLHPLRLATLAEVSGGPEVDASGKDIENVSLESDGA